MSHYLAYVLLPEPPTDPDHLRDMLRTILAPYDEALEVEERVETWTDDNGQLQEERYPHNPRGLWDYWLCGKRARWFQCFGTECNAARVSDLPERPAPPFTLFTLEGYRTKIEWETYPESIIPDEEWLAWWERFYAQLPADAWLAAVDYHS